jgi:SRSO17 transposase
MDLEGLADSESRFSAYVGGLVSVIGHADRAGPLRDYCMGLVMPCERKSVEPMAAVTAPERTAAQHQSLLHFVGQASWSDEAVLGKVREMVLPAIEAHGPIEAWIIDDTGFPKKGRHSVGVTRQYCGELGKQDNCQVAVSLSLANSHASLPVAWRLYLPQDWAEDAARRHKVGVPEEIGFKTKPQIALEQIRFALESGLPRGVLLLDAGYGVDARLRTSVSALGLIYVAGILPNTLIWMPGAEPEPGRQRPRKGRRGEPQVTSAKEIALGLPKTAWRRIEWREGVAEPLASRFARLRVCPAHRHETAEGRPQEWLLIEWPEDEDEPTKYWLSTAAQDMAFERLVDLAKLRWRIERDYQDLKQEVGLGHYEGRGWRGFHHHATLCIAAYGFLISERETIPPSGPGAPWRFQKLALPRARSPRGSPTAPRAAHPQLDRHPAATAHRRPCDKPAPMSMLLCSDSQQHKSAQFMTQ